MNIKSFFSYFFLYIYDNFPNPDIHKSIDGYERRVNFKLLKVSHRVCSFLIAIPSYDLRNDRLTWLFGKFFDRCELDVNPDVFQMIQLLTRRTRIGLILKSIV